MKSMSLKTENTSVQSIREMLQIAETIVFVVTEEGYIKPIQQTKQKKQKQKQGKQARKTAEHMLGS